MKSADRKGHHKTTNLVNKEEEFKRLNAELEEKTASLINEADLVLRGQEDLFGDLDSADGKLSKLSLDQNIVPRQPNKKPITAKPPSALTSKKRPVSGPAGGVKKREVKKQTRPASSKDSHVRKVTSPMALVEERAMFADRIHAMELEAEDELYTPSNLNEHVLPEVAAEMSSDATIRFLKAKLRVMQEELESVSTECRKKSSEISELHNELKDKESENSNLLRKNDQLQKTIDKHKKLQTELQTKNTDLESDLSSLKKEIDSTQRNIKHASANKNTLEVRLNRALEEVEKHKLALKNSKESSKAMSDSDRKRFEQLQDDNKRLEIQKAELLAAFKKQLKLIDILKRQKMHIEAAKMLEFTEEEFIRALEWGTT